MSIAKTPEEIKSMMIELVKAVKEAEVPEDLRVTAFEKGFDALMGTTAGSGKASQSREDPAPHKSETPSAGPSLDAIARRLSLDPELVGEIYYVDGDHLGLVVAASKLPAAKAAATKQIALLVAAGRQAGGWDEWTPSTRIRDIVRDYGRFDVANFATTIKRMGDVFSFRGRGREIEVRLTRPGYEQATNLARELGGM